VRESKNWALASGHEIQSFPNPNIGIGCGPPGSFKKNCESDPGPRWGQWEDVLAPFYTRKAVRKLAREKGRPQPGKGLIAAALEGANGRLAGGEGFPY